MARPEITQIILVEDTRAFEAGAYESASFIVPIGVDVCQLAIDRQSLPPAPRGEKSCIKVQAWISYDGGRKFDLLIGFTTSGGEIRDPRTGEVMNFPNSYARRHIKPQYKENDRMMKVLVDSRVPLTTKIIVEFW